MKRKKVRFSVSFQIVARSTDFCKRITAQRAGARRRYADVHLHALHGGQHFVSHQQEGQTVQLMGWVLSRPVQSAASEQLFGSPRQ